MYSIKKEIVNILSEFLTNVFANNMQYHSVFLLYSLILPGLLF